MCNVLGNPKYRKCYLSGPMTGIEELNKPQFEKYATKLRNMNLEVINPHDLFTQQEIEKLNQRVEQKEITAEEMYNTFMKRDIKFMMDCDFVAVLPNWESSNGARIEIHLARQVKMPIIMATDFSEINYKK